MLCPVAEGGAPPGRLNMGYRPELDGVRALAITAVVFFHLKYLSGGYLGVDLFFVLSGFLITFLLLAEQARAGRASLKRFYQRRVRRLLPALLVVGAFVLAAAVVLVNHPARHPSIIGVPASIFYLSAWLEAFQVSGLGAMGHTWSLSVEEYFYLLWPLLLGFLVRRPKHLVRNAAIVTLVAVGYQLAAQPVFGWSNYRVFYAPDTRADELLIGCLLAVLVSRGPLRAPERRAGRLALASLGLLGGAFVAAMAFGAPSTLLLFYHGPWVVAVATASALLLAWLFLVPGSLVARGLCWKPVVWIGVRSYGIYLWHYPFIWLLQPYIHSKAELAVVVIGATLAVSAASYRFLETPLRRRGLEAIRSVLRVEAEPL